MISEKPDHRPARPEHRLHLSSATSPWRRGALVLAVGLPLLAATAIAGRLWAPTESPEIAAAPVDMPPRIWEVSLVGLFDPDGVRFAAPEIDEVPLPRAVSRAVSRAARPTQSRNAEDGAAERPTAPAAADTRTDTQTDTRTDTALAVLPATPRSLFTRPAPRGQVTPQARVFDHAPPAVPPRRPDRAASALAQAPEAAGTETPAQQLAAADTGLERSPLPRARPEFVTRLASVEAAPLAQPIAASLSTPAPAAVPPATLQVPALAAGAAADRCDSRLARTIPRRPSGAAGGRAALASLAGSGGSARDNAIVQAIVAGNLPDFLRTLVPVTFTGTGPDGRAARITLCVMPDYLAIGSDNDFVRVPLGLPAASRIAEHFDMVLPTTRMVDAIHAQARLRLTPAPMTPGAQMASTDYFLRHNATLESQRQNAGAPLGVLVSGHKKDVVLTNRLQSNPGRVAIYGWHRASGQPIQPLSTVHGAQYADYSHGIRLISRTAYVNGRAVDLRDLLADGRYAGMISSEGPIAPRLMLASLR